MVVKLLLRTELVQKHDPQKSGPKNMSQNRSEPLLKFILQCLANFAAYCRYTQ